MTERGEESPRLRERTPRGDYRGGIRVIAELVARLEADTGQHTFWSVFETPIHKARHGDSSGVRGAAWLCEEDR